MVAGYQTRKEQIPGFNITTLKKENIETIYSDGFGNLSVGVSVAKIELFNVIDTTQSPDGNGETRLTDTVLTIPTVALVEFAAKVLVGYVQNSAAMNAGSAAIKGTIDGLIASLKA